MLRTSATFFCQHLRTGDWEVRKVGVFIRLPLQNQFNSEIKLRMDQIKHVSTLRYCIIHSLYIPWFWPDNSVKCCHPWVNIFTYFHCQYMHFEKDSVVKINFSNWSKCVGQVYFGYNHRYSSQRWRITCHSRGGRGRIFVYIFTAQRSYTICVKRWTIIKQKISFSHSFPSGIYKIL